ncbi:hypothetical protein TWF481_009880 [Arthrobotrys musiformis]|uniref:BTB domain-containing protein n=1 Tax=Arthrobotrys musiformis TaxID=47236 RepID=A0AAV9W629_9PEZI
MVTTRSASLRHRKSGRNARNQAPEVEDRSVAPPDRLPNAAPPPSIPADIPPAIPPALPPAVPPPVHPSASRPPPPPRLGSNQQSNRLSWMGPAEFKEEDVDIDLRQVVVRVVDDANHDITIIMTHHQHRFRYFVSRNVLSLSSPAIHQMLQTNVKLELPTGGDPGQSPEESEWTLHLEGSPQAMHVVLMMLHLKAIDGFFNISFELFTEISVLCDKYGWQDALRPWVRSWLDKFTKNVLKPGHENWLYAAKVFGSDKKVKELIAALAEEISTPNDGGSFVFRREKRISKALWPEAITNQIMQLRSTEIMKLSTAIRSLVDTLKDGSADCRRLCSSQSCIDHALGSLLRSVSQNGLSILLDTHKEWPGSVNVLRDHLSAVRFDTLEKLTPSHTCALGTLKDKYYLLVQAGAKKEAPAPPAFGLQTFPFFE